MIMIDYVDCSLMIMFMVLNSDDRGVKSVTRRMINCAFT